MLRETEEDAKNPFSVEERKAHIIQELAQRDMSTTESTVSSQYLTSPISHMVEMLVTKLNRNILGKRSKISPLPRSEKR